MKREEIAKALRDASIPMVLLGKNFEERESFKKIYLEMAAQIENMRCETCKRADQAAVPYCRWFSQSVTKDFYCAAHEAR